MKTYWFTVELVEKNVFDQATEDKIFGIAADGLITRRDGTNYIDFSREAESLESAIKSTFLGIKSIGLTPKHATIDPRDLLEMEDGLTHADLSEMANCERPEGL